MTVKSQPGANSTMQRILDRYRRGGVDAVRAMLREKNTPEVKIAQIVAQLQQNFPDLPTKLTMPLDSINSNINNAYVARTSNRPQTINWMRKHMQDSARWARENKDLMTATFFDALAGILKDESVTLADDNPYQQHLIELIEALKIWKSYQ